MSLFSDSQVALRQTDNFIGCLKIGQCHWGQDWKLIFHSCGILLCNFLQRWSKACTVRMISCKPQEGYREECETCNKTPHHSLISVCLTSDLSLFDLCLISVCLTSVCLTSVWPQFVSPLSVLLSLSGGPEDIPTQSPRRHGFLQWERSATEIRVWHGGRSTGPAPG